MPLISCFECGPFAVISNVLFHIEFFNSRQRAFKETVTVCNIVSICCFLVGHTLLIGAYTAVFL